MGWFSRNINKIRAICAAAALILPGAAGAFLLISEGMNAAGWKFEDAELSPSDAAILDPWAIRFAAFYDKMLKIIGSSQSAADLNTIKSYCCTMVNQYAYDMQGLSKEGRIARDNFIYKTFEALNAGINVRANELNLGSSRYWAEVSTLNFNDPIYQGQLISEVIECEHYGVAGMQPTVTAPTTPIYTAPTTPIYTAPIVPTTPIPVKPVGTIRPSKDVNVFDQILQNTTVNPVKPSAPQTNPIKTTTPITANDIEAVDAEILEDDEDQDKSLLQKYKWPIAILVAAVAAKQIFSNNN